jgi:hypothetical protein
MDRHRLFYLTGVTLGVLAHAPCEAQLSRTDSLEVIRAAVDFVSEPGLRLHVCGPQCRMFTTPPSDSLGEPGITQLLTELADSIVTIHSSRAALPPACDWRDGVSGSAYELGFADLTATQSTATLVVGRNCMKAEFSGYSNGLTLFLERDNGVWIVVKSERLWVT